MPHSEAAKNVGRSREKRGYISEFKYTLPTASKSDVNIVKVAITEWGSLGNRMESRRSALFLLVNPCKATYLCKPE